MSEKQEQNIESTEVNSNNKAKNIFKSLLCLCGILVVFIGIAGIADHYREGVKPGFEYFISEAPIKARLLHGDIPDTLDYRSQAATLLANEFNGYEVEAAKLNWINGEQLKAAVIRELSKQPITNLADAARNQTPVAKQLTTEMVKAINTFLNVNVNYDEMVASKWFINSDELKAAAIIDVSTKYKPEEIALNVKNGSEVMTKRALAIIHQYETSSYMQKAKLNYMGLDEWVAKSGK